MCIFYGLGFKRKLKSGDCIRLDFEFQNRQLKWLISVKKKTNKQFFASK